MNTMSFEPFLQEKTFLLLYVNPPLKGILIFWRPTNFYGAIVCVLNMQKAEYMVMFQLSQSMPSLISSGCLQQF